MLSIVPQAGLERFLRRMRSCKYFRPELSGYTTHLMLYGRASLLRKVSCCLRIHLPYASMVRWHGIILRDLEVSPQFGKTLLRVSKPLLLLRLRSKHSMSISKIRSLRNYIQHWICHPLNQEEKSRLSANLDKNSICSGRSTYGKHQGCLSLKTAQRQAATAYFSLLYRSLCFIQNHFGHLLPSTNRLPVFAIHSMLAGRGLLLSPLRLFR